MLLVLDIGNSQVTVGIFDDKNLIHKWGMKSSKKCSTDEYGIMLLNFLNSKNLKDKVDSSIISSVVTNLTDKIRCSIIKYLDIEPKVVTHKVNMGGITLKVDRDEDVGADRICNIVGAYSKYKVPMVVVDMGTATTFDVINVKGEFIGGAISAGIGLSIDTLAKSTSLLPETSVDEIQNVIATTTISNILSGTVIGHAALIDGMIIRIEKELGSPVTTVGTGGYSIYVEKHLCRKFDHFEPNLTLEGLRILYEINS